MVQNPKKIESTKIARTKEGSFQSRILSGPNTPGILQSKLNQKAKHNRSNPVLQFSYSREINAIVSYFTFIAWTKFNFRSSTSNQFILIQHQIVRWCVETEIADRKMVSRKGLQTRNIAERLQTPIQRSFIFLSKN